MNNSSLFIFRSKRFDGNIFAKITNPEDGKKYLITLLREGEIVATLSGPVCVFPNQVCGHYSATATISEDERSHSPIKSNNIHIPTSALLQGSQNAGESHHTPQVLAGKRYREYYDNVDRFFLYITLHNETDFEKLKIEPLLLTILTSHNTGDACVIKPVNNLLFGNILANTCTVKPDCDFEKLVAVADELELLDYVTACSIEPDTKNMIPVVDSCDQILDGTEKFDDHWVKVDAVTLSYHNLQTYLQPTSDTVKGMNVLSAWDEGETGAAATVRHLDYGVYHNHENLKGNINVVHSRPDSCNHGTASTGIIAASRLDFGVTGIAHNCSYYFYDTADLDLIVRDAVPGDIVSLNTQLDVGGKFLPIIHLRSWWDKVFALTQKGVVVILAAGNGGNDLSGGVMNQYGDSGGSLIGACLHNSGRRKNVSNYNHPTSLMNSWGERVTTTGYGNLNPAEKDVNRQYTGSFQNTSSATPLVSGVLALIQSYAISHYGFYLNAQEMRELISETGSTEAVNDGIGHRPDAEAAIRRLRQENETATVRAVIDGPAEVKPGRNVILSGENSHSSEAEIYSFEWQVPAGINTETRHLSTLIFEAPDVTEPKKFIFTLKVTDALGFSARADHTLHVINESRTEYPQWDANTIYILGDRVSWNNRNWQAEWWNINTEPKPTGSIYPGPWREIA